MSSPDTSEIYDGYYFTHGCGRPYQRDEHWLNFFDKIAERIAIDIAPKTVLDAGCAMGFLIEALRKREIAAWGIDISEYAIENVHPDTQPYCWVGSVTDPFPQKYDLIISIEVLEHLPKEESEQALGNLCRYADDILFSSTPFDYKESTHLNVQPPEYWAASFARQGFFRDIDFDASFTTSWAARFRRKSEPVHRTIRDYERKFWVLWKENTDLRDQSITEEQRMRMLTQEIGRLRAQVNHWEDLQKSFGWKILHFARLGRLRLAPRGSRRANLIRLAIRSLQVLRHRGLVGFIRITFRILITRRQQAVNIGTAPIKIINAKAYEEWLVEHAINTDELDRQRESSESFVYKPLMSVITPVYNPPPQVLRETIESVLTQTYGNWEFCLVDGNSKSPEVKAILSEFAEKDERIRVKYLAQNLGLSGNTNEALEMAQGEFVAFLDHDDLLAPEAFYEVVKLLNEARETDFIYFDEDKLSEDGRVRRDPLFKPDWSPELLLSANYLTHAVVRRSLVMEAGGLDPEMDGAQDWDLAFRCTERTSDIEHIPKVLYHWRQIGGSTAGRFGAKPWVFDAQLCCVENHLERIGVKQAKVTFPTPGFFRVAWPILGSKVSIIIPTKENVAFLLKCLTSISQMTAYPEFEIILVDNGSSEEKTLKYYQTIKRDARIRIVDYPGAFNYSAANNLGAQHATGDLLLFMNNDIEVLEPDWLEEMVRWAERPKIGVVGAKLLYPDLTIQHAGVVVGMEGHASHVYWGAREKDSGPFGSVDWYRNYSAVTGACMMIPREVFDEIGGFDEDYILTLSDIEICVRITNLGYRVVYTPFARLKHYEGKSRRDYIPAHDVQVGIDHLMSLVEVGDPYFNPNLSYTTRVPTIARRDEENQASRLRRIAATQHDFGSQYPGV